MAVNGWEGVKMAGVPGNGLSGLKQLEMARQDWKWLEMDGNSLKCLYGRKWLQMAGKRQNKLEMVKLAGNGCKQIEITRIDGSCCKRLKQL